MFWKIFERIMPGLFRGKDYDYDAIRLVLEAFVPREQWPWYFDRCLDVIGVIQEIRGKGK